MKFHPALLGLALTLAPALADAPPSAPPVTDWSNVETVVVRPGDGGPALWHIVKGDSEVWILPTVSPMPKDLKWDSTGITDLLKGSHVMLTPPTASVGLADGLWFFAWHRDTLEQPDGTTLESTLPQPMRQHFVNWRNRIGRDADRYDDYLGGVSALRLEGDYYDYANFSPNAAQKAVEALARHAGVSIRATATYDAMGVVRDIPKMSAEAHRTCMELALKDMDTFSAHAAAAAAAWATGDLEGMKAHYSETRLDACLAQSGAYSALRETANRDMTNAILGALNKPGKTFAVMPMGFFLRKGGVLDRLEAAGLTVSGPGG